MKTEFLTINRYERTCLQVKILLFMGLTRGVTSSSTGEGRRSALESAPWFKSLGARKFDSSLRHACVYYICYSFNRFFGSWLSVRTDICDKASEEVMNLNYLLFIFFIVIIIRVLPVRAGLLLQGRKVAAEHHYNKPF